MNQSIKTCLKRTLYTSSRSKALFLVDYPAIAVLRGEYYSHGIALILLVL